MWADLGPNPITSAGFWGWTIQLHFAVPTGADLDTADSVIGIKDTMDSVWTMR